MAKQKYTSNEVIEVVWDDAATTQSWPSPNCKGLKENSGVVRCCTVGYFVRETKSAIQITQGYSYGSKDLKDTQAIPANAIRKTRRLK